MILPCRINPIIKLTEECNYSCFFCRYANHRQHDDGIALETVYKLLDECVAYNKSMGISGMNVIFHGGEPLVYGLNRLEKIVKYEQSLVSDDFTIINSIQTNSSLIDDLWIDFFKKYNFSVGISLDGPKELNGHHSEDRDLSVKNAVAAYHRLKKEEIDCGFLCVITEQHLEDPKKLFDFWIDNHIESVGLCYCYNKVDDTNVDPIALGNYLIELFDLYFNSQQRISIREFDMAMRFILGRPHHECTMSCRKSCGTFITVRPDGSIEFCDDYDLYHRCTLGNINKTSLVELLSSKNYTAKILEARKIIKTHCENCDIYDICRSGCSRNDTETGNYFCETYKIIYSYMRTVVSPYLNHEK